MVNPMTGHHLKPAFSLALLLKRTRNAYVEPIPAFCQKFSLPACIRRPAGEQEQSTQTKRKIQKNREQMHLTGQE
jgi:hypothetical protein